MIKVKEGVDYNDIYFLTDEMFLMLGFCSWFYKTRFGKDMVITSLKSDRPPRTGDIHAQGRAVDLRTRDLTKQQKEGLLFILNTLFKYDLTGRKCAIIHDSGSGEHLHIQAPSTGYKSFVDLPLDFPSI